MPVVRRLDLLQESCLERSVQIALNCSCELENTNRLVFSLFLPMSAVHGTTIEHRNWLASKNTAQTINTIKDKIKTQRSYISPVVLKLSHVSNSLTEQDKVGDLEWSVAGALDLSRYRFWISEMERQTMKLHMYRLSVALTAALALFCVAPAPARAMSVECNTVNNNNFNHYDGAYRLWTADDVLCGMRH